MRPLKYWNGPRVEAEGTDGKKRVRRIPAAGCNERATRPDAPSASRQEGCVAFGPESFRGCSLGRDRCGYRRCARALASAKNRQQRVPFQYINDLISVPRFARLVSQPALTQQQPTRCRTSATAKLIHVEKSNSRAERGYRPHATEEKQS